MNKKIISIIFFQLIFSIEINISILSNGMGYTYDGEPIDIRVKIVWEPP